MPNDLTPEMLADALDCFWNAALGAARERQSEVAADVASVMVQGFAAVATRLRENSVAPKASGDCVSLLADLDACKPVQGEAASTLRRVILERDTLLEALASVKQVAEISKDEFWSLSEGERAISSCGVIKTHVDRILQPFEPITTGCKANELSSYG